MCTGRFLVGLVAEIDIPQCPCEAHNNNTTSKRDETEVDSSHHWPKAKPGKPRRWNVSFYFGPILVPRHSLQCSHKGKLGRDDERRGEGRTTHFFCDCHCRYPRKLTFERKLLNLRHRTGKQEANDAHAQGSYMIPRRSPFQPLTNHVSPNRRGRENTGRARHRSKRNCCHLFSCAWVRRFVRCGATSTQKAKTYFCVPKKQGSHPRGRKEEGGAVGSAQSNCKKDRRRDPSCKACVIWFVVDRSCNPCVNLT